MKQTERKRQWSQCRVGFALCAWLCLEVGCAAEHHLADSDAGRRDADVLDANLTSRDAGFDASQLDDAATYPRDAGLDAAITNDPDAGALDAADVPIAIDAGEADSEVVCLEGDAGIYVGDFGENDFNSHGTVTDPSVLTGIREITGNLNLALTWYPTERALACLERVGGNLAVQPHDYTRTSLAGLERLREVGGTFSIGHNHGGYVTGFVRSVAPLRSLERVGGDFLPGLNDVPSLAGLERLQYVGGDLALDGSGLIESLQPLRNLRVVRGVLRISGASTLLPRLDGLEGLTELGGLSIGWMDLTSLDGLPALTRLPRGLHLSFMPNLTSIAALSSVQELGDVWIEHAAMLTDLSPLSQVTRLTSLVLQTTPIASLDGLANLEEVTEEISINGTAITTLNLPSLRRANRIWVSGSVAAFGALQVSTLERLEIEHTELTSLAGLETLTHVTGALIFHSNTQLASVAGLSSLQRVGTLSVHQSPLLTSLAGLSALETVDMSCSLTELDALTDLNGLSSLQQVGRLTVAGNATLRDVSRMESVTNASGVLELYRNAALSHCATTALANTMQTQCTCPANTQPECEPICYDTPNGPACFLCDTIQFCDCEGTCECGGNDNSTPTCP